jgi:hypothetical protein
MSDHTRLEPLTPERARQLFGMMREAQDSDGKALALDNEGRLTAVVEADDLQEQHLLRDLDVHA